MSSSLMSGSQRQRPLVEVFADVPDPRAKRGRRYRLAVVLALVASAVLAGCSSFLAMGEHVQDLSKEQLARLGLDPEARRPRLSTIRRVPTPWAPGQAVHSPQRRGDAVRACHGSHHSGGPGITDPSHRRDLQVTGCAAPDHLYGMGGRAEGGLRTPMTGIPRARQHGGQTPDAPADPTWPTRQRSADQGAGPDPVRFGCTAAPARRVHPVHRGDIQDVGDMF